MFRLHLLAGSDLLSPAGAAVHSVVAQPKRFALLAYLALAAPRTFHRRDTLLAMFWPERDEKHARNALSKSLHYLRASLGAGAILSRGADEVGMSRERVWCDAVEFEEALAAGEAERALELYRGDLLPGLLLDDALEFERWLARERERLRTRAADAARGLTEREVAAGRADEAVRWARRAAELAPLDEGAARALMELLDRNGDRAAALLAYAELAQRLREELEVEPAPETQALAERVRARTGFADAAPAGGRGAGIGRVAAAEDLPPVPLDGRAPHTRWLRAEMLHAAGRLREALRWYATFPEPIAYDLPYLAPAHLRRAEIHERLGDRREAVWHYEAVLDIWRDPDPELRPELDAVRHRLAQLQGG
ncbi:BTAD domain-containing putative transcriptional regulator [Longimicrobium sp.]|uniref:BTAD domain-containing putative transcriptional regulator n=1 Tax=Longimicrobium sp. TaxID=2029185 RepID=UPI003B3AA6D1